jgi:hypothetical protein
MEYSEEYINEREKLRLIVNKEEKIRYNSMLYSLYTKYYEDIINNLLSEIDIFIILGYTKKQFKDIYIYIW